MNFNECVEFLNSDITSVKGVGEKKASLLRKIGIFSVWDLVYNFPRNYDNRTLFLKISDLTEGTVCCVNCIISGAVIEKKIKKNMSLYIIRAEDATGTMTVKWFSSPFNKSKLKRGERYTFYGNITSGGAQKEMVLREAEPLGENKSVGRIVPVYSTTSGLSQNDIRKYIDFTLKKLGWLPETLPESILNSHGLISIWEAVFEMHCPTNEITLSKARHRLAFEELFILCLAMKHMRKLNDKVTSVKIQDVKCVSDFAQRLPFSLTSDQKKCVNEICADFKKGTPMNRLVQGDVGSGKTCVAACASYAAIKNGYQVAVMAPTEILASQHYETFSRFFKEFDIKVGLITSSSKNKKEIYELISSGYYDVVIGTHAIIQDKVSFNNLGLCITDEQHRFGVKQRARLATDHNLPHVLVMSATPIPRTLSLVVYGDLDISVIASMPKGRQKVDTFCVNHSMRERLNSFIKKQADSGFQCFVVCPLIESSEDIDAASGAETFERIKRDLPMLKTQFLHGKMSPSQKEEIMENFRMNKFDVLVSTTVIEVGIDIPNATLMVIENAERFGLSQLHQLRGRVGRGTEKSYCVLVCDTKTDDAKERMRIMCSTSDGFKVAQEDLKLRGCGEFFGTRQHGLPEFKVANLFTDIPIVNEAKAACDAVMKLDPNLSGEEFISLRMRIKKMFSDFDQMQIFN